MDAVGISRVQAELNAARQADTPERALLAALAAADRALSGGREPDLNSLAERARAAQGAGLDKREAIQLARLAGLGQRAQAGVDIDPLDAEQALTLAQTLADRLGPASAPSAPLLDTPAAPILPPAPFPTPPALPPAPFPEPAPPWPAEPLLEPASAPPLEVFPDPAPAAPTLSAPPVLRAARRPRPLVDWGVFALWAALTLVILALGPLVLALLGPPWMRYVALVPALGTAWLAARALGRLAAGRGRFVAALGALTVGVGLGMGWGLAAERGWLPPMNYALDIPVPRVTQATRAIAPQLRLGATARVEGTQGNGLRVRAEPGLDAVELARLPDGTRVRLSAGPVSVDGIEWWQVQTGGTIGWAASPYLTPLD